MCGDEGSEEVDAHFCFESDNLTACTADVGADVEGFPQVVDGGWTGHGALVEKDADIEDGPKGVEEPAGGFLKFHLGRR